MAPAEAWEAEGRRVGKGLDAFHAVAVLGRDAARVEGLVAATDGAVIVGDSTPYSLPPNRIVTTIRTPRASAAIRTPGTPARPGVALPTAVPTSTGPRRSGPSSAAIGGGALT